MRPSAKLHYNSREMALIALFAALTAVMTQIIIPLQPVPLSLGLFGVLLCAAVLPLKLSFTAQLVYLLLGAFGAPVFSYFSGGFHKLVGPTGGYLVGYLALTLVVGLLQRRFPRAGMLGGAVILGLGVAVCHALGTLWLAVGLGYTPGQAFLVGSAPFLVFDACKAVGAAAVGLRLRALLGRSDPSPMQRLP